MSQRDGKLTIGIVLRHIGVAKNSLFCLYIDRLKRKSSSQMDEPTLIVPNAINGHHTKGFVIHSSNLEKPFN